MEKDILELFRAKSRGDKNFLLKDHLRETIIRAETLRNFVEKNKPANRYNKFNKEFFESLIMACFLHDLGKIEWKFQFSLFDREKDDDKQILDNLSNFFKNFYNLDIMDHEVISILYSIVFLENSAWDMKIRTAVLLHHYNSFYVNNEVNIRYIFDAYPDLVKYLDFLNENKETIKDILKRLLDYLSQGADEETKSVLDRLKSNADKNFEKLKKLREWIEIGSITTMVRMFDPTKAKQPEIEDFFVFLGCLRRCDYSASGNVDIEKNMKLSDIYTNAHKKIKSKLNQQPLWQENLLSQCDSDALVLVAPTGSGKTEFALLWAKNRGKKLVYTLPLRVALNDLYSRFTNKDKGYFDQESLSILHSTSFIEYLKEEREGKKLDIEAKNTSAKLFSYPLSLTTPDQVFLSSLKYYGSDKLFSIYPLSAVVVDEIQAYNPEMAAVIIKTLEIIRRLSGSLLIITATFPPYFREWIRNPDFTILDTQRFKDQVKNYGIKRHKIELIENAIFEWKDNDKMTINEKSLERIMEIINEDRNILIIVNNVAKAIELYKKLDSKLEATKNLYLLHSRLIEKEKSKRISEIKERLEKLKEEKKVVLVATQIVEASVDVDFDVLITEISPIDSQIQRWGRVYRNKEKEGDYEGTPNIFIFTTYDKATSAIYDKRILDKTIECLKNYRGMLLTYEDEKKLIEDVFKLPIDGGKTLEQIYIEEIANNLKFLEYYSTEKRSEAQRLFRRIAGVPVVVPQLMEGEKDEKLQKFAKIVMDPTKKDISWKDIKEELKESTDNFIWIFKARLYEYSINLPIFYFENHRSLFLHEFKGFYVLKELEKVENVRKYGIDYVLTTIDEEEINDSSNIF